MFVPDAVAPLKDTETINAKQEHKLAKVLPFRVNSVKSRKATVTASVRRPVLAMAA